MNKALFYFISLFFSLGLTAQNITIGARQAALGGASITLDDVYSAQNNQAGLGFMKNASVGAYYENRFLLKQLSYSSFVAAVPIKKAGCFGMVYSGFGYSLFKQSKVGLDYGLLLSENFSAGVGINYLSYKTGDATYGKASAFTVELGLQGKLSKQVMVAAHIYNPNRAKITDYNNEQIPSQLQFGIQYRVSKQLLILGEAEKSSYSNINIKGGLEYAPAKEFYIRGGVNSYPTQASFGFGYNSDNFKVDLSSSYHSILGFSPQIGLSYVFGKIKTEEEQ